VGYTPYPTAVTKAFVNEAASTGVDIFRIFDALNDVSQMRPAIEAVRATGTAVAEGGALLHRQPAGPGRKALHAGLLPAPRRADRRCRRPRPGDQGHGRVVRAPAAATLVLALRSRFDLPVHLHTHDTAGGQLATLLSAINAGVDAVDVASAPMSGTTSQPSMSALIAATDGTDRETGLDFRLYATSSRTGRACAACMPRSSRGSPPPPAGSTP